MAQDNRGVVWISLSEQKLDTINGRLQKKLIKYALHLVVLWATKWGEKFEISLKPFFAIFGFYCSATKTIALV